jgi:hypothetical protein
MMWRHVLSVPKSLQKFIKNHRIVVECCNRAHSSWNLLHFPAVLLTQTAKCTSLLTSTLYSHKSGIENIKIKVFNKFVELTKIIGFLNLNLGTFRKTKLKNNVIKHTFVVEFFRNSIVLKFYAFFEIFKLEICFPIKTPHSRD